MTISQLPAIRDCGCGKPPKRMELRATKDVVLVHYECCLAGKPSVKENYAIANWNKRANDKFGRKSKKDRGGDKVAPVEPVV